MKNVSGSFRRYLPLSGGIYQFTAHAVPETGFRLPETEPWFVGGAAPQTLG
jgi:hypothetical protein